MRQFRSDDSCNEKQQYVDRLIYVLLESSHKSKCKKDSESTYLIKKGGIYMEMIKETAKVVRQQQIDEGIFDMELSLSLIHISEPTRH